MSREWRMFLDDAISFCELILEFTEGMDQEQFAADRKTRDAILRNLELLGEAVKNFPEAVCARYSQVPWAKIIGLRNILAHVYFSLDIPMIWEVVSARIPALLEELHKIETDLNAPPTT